MDILANFSKTSHKISLILHILTTFWIYIWNNLVEVPGKFCFRPFWALFGPNLPLFGPKSTFWFISSKRFIEFCWFWYSNLSYCLVLENWCLQSGEMLPRPFWTLFGPNFHPLWPKINILAYISSKRLIKSHADFLYRNLSCVLLLENWCLPSGKI